MKRIHFSSALALAALLSALPACVEGPPEDELDDELYDDDGVAETVTPSVTDDNLNGLWTTTVAGKNVGTTIIESWSAVGIRLTSVQGKVHQLSRSVDA